MTKIDIISGFLGAGKTTLIKKLLKDGFQGEQVVLIENEFGEIELLAKVTPRVVPGTVAVSQGAWHDADMAGDRVDKGGSINTLTTQRPSPLSKGNPQHTNICEVSKA